MRSAADALPSWLWVPELGDADARLLVGRVAPGDRVAVLQVPLLVARDRDEGVGGLGIDLAEGALEHLELRDRALLCSIR